MQVNLENNKYSLIFDEATGTLLANRNGEHWMDYSGNKFVYLLLARIVELESELTSVPTHEPLSDEQIESLREKTFSTGNPYCAVDSKSMRKAARAIEAHHGIKE